jgi:drug/metabolite transporter (DMT)-like permease
MGRGLALAAFTGVCWAILAIGLKYALQFTSSGTIVWIRMAWAALLLAAFFLIRNPKSIKNILKRTPLMAVGAAAFLATNYFTYIKGLEMTSASNAQIMIQLGPITFLLIGVFIFEEVLQFTQWLGVAIALGGFGLFNWDQVLVTVAQAQNALNSNASSTYLIGNAWLIVGAVSWAIFAAFQKRLIQKHHWKPQDLNLIIYMLSTVLLAPLANFSELLVLNFHQMFILFLLGLNTLLAYGAFAEANKLAPASYVSLIISCNPLLTIAIMKILEQIGSTIVTPEPILWRGYVGAALVVAGVSVAVSFKKKTRLPPTPA